jgi:hypothetical protein
MLVLTMMQEMILIWVAFHPTLLLNHLSLEVDLGILPHG